MRPLARAPALAAGAILTAGLVVGSSLPYSGSSAEQALIRLSWRAVGERVEECREPTPEELAALPPHMRQTEICEARLEPFQLKVAIDGAGVFDGRISPGGARGDRPSYVFEEFLVPPGPHRLAVEFRTESVGGGSAPDRPPLRLDQSVELAPRDILLVTTGPEGDRLMALGASR